MSGSWYLPEFLSGFEPRMKEAPEAECQGPEAQTCSFNCEGDQQWQVCSVAPCRSIPSLDPPGFALDLQGETGSEQEPSGH